jgi:predicted nucleic acid-binding protein
MPTKVIDASALAAVLFGEPAAADVSKRVEGQEVVAPTLLRYEVGSVCLKKIKRYPEQREALVQALAVFSQLEIREVEVPPVEATLLAEREDLTVYDAAYLWLTRALAAEIVTLDAHLRAAAAR